VPVSVWAAALCAAACLVSPAFAQPPPVTPAPALLAVPYLPQTEALCGGAAAAMVMRYWGAQDVYPDAFAPLVDRSAGGIRTSALVSALEQRRWTAVAGAGDTAQMTRELARGRPVIALIEDRPGRFHYVVVVSAAAGKIVLHDPARAPSRVMDLEKFDLAWQKSQRWLLILLPPPPGSGLGLRPSSGPVGEAVGLAERGEKAAARRALEAAAVSCPAASAPWRELAGLDALDENWPSAAEHARRAVTNDPEDAHAWRVLATAEYLRHDDLAALAAWNRIGEPRVDLVDIKGLEYTRYMVIADAIGVRPREVLTPHALRVAQRRVLAVPAIAAARVSFQPRENGRAQIDASVAEHTRAPTTYASWLGIGLRAAIERELATSLSSVSGGGDVIALSWRWWAHRPMVAVSYAAPGPGGVWRFDASRETQTFGAPGPPGFKETRTRAGVEISNWIDQRIRVRGGAAIDGWTDRPRTAAVSGRVEFWPLVDRLALEAGGAAWRGPDISFGGADAAARWRSTRSSTGTVWRADAGYRLVSASSPASIWPGADTGHARDVLLRAHPLLDDGVIRDGVFGRRLAFGALEIQQWLKPGKRPVRIAPAAFIDIARAARGLPTSTDRTQVDAGVGLRLSLLGRGVLRVDVAHGLRDGHNALSVGWQR
jgi:peptidase C39-like protein